jgi:hypothetical protein
VSPGHKRTCLAKMAVTRRGDGDWLLIGQFAHAVLAGCMANAGDNSYRPASILSSGPVSRGRHGARPTSTRRVWANETSI